MWKCQWEASTIKSKVKYSLYAAIKLILLKLSMQSASSNGDRITLLTLVIFLLSSSLL